MQTMRQTQDKKIEFQEISRAAAKRQIFGILYVSRDKNNNLVEDLKKATIEQDVLEEAVYDYMLNSRVMGTMHIGKVETPVKFGRVIESFVITDEKMEALNIPLGLTYRCAWWVGFQVESNLVWQELEKGNLPDLSLRGIAHVVYEKEKDG